MITLTGNIQHPAIASIACPNAYIETHSVIVREPQGKMTWMCSIWATLEDRNNESMTVMTDSGTMPYDASVLIDEQLQAAMIAGTSGGTVDYSNAAPA